APARRPWCSTTPTPDTGSRPRWPASTAAARTASRILPDTPSWPATAAASPAIPRCPAAHWKSPAASAARCRSGPAPPWPAMAAGAVLAPGSNGLGTLTVDGDLALREGAILDFEFGPPGPDIATPGSSDSVSVAGDLALEGATLRIADAGGFGPGLYRLFDYGGALSLTNGVLSLDPAAGDGLHLQYLTGEQRINPLIPRRMILQFWIANGLATPGRLGGGSGTWSHTAVVWTDADGSLTGPMQPQPGFAIFGGDA